MPDPKKKELEDKEKEAIKKHKEMYGDVDKDKEEPVDNKEVDDNPDDNPDNPDNPNKPINQDPNPEAQDPAPAAPEPATPDDGDDKIDWKSRAQDLESRLKVVQGKYDAEVPDLHRKVKEMEEALVDIRSGFSAQPMGTPQQPAPESVDSPDTVSTDQPPEPSTVSPALEESRFEDYGDEIQDVVKVVNNLQKELGDIRALKREISQVKNHVTRFAKTTEKNETDTFLSEINKEFPGIESWGDDPVVNQWLAQTDPVSGYSYGALAGNHFKTRNAKGYIEVMRRFIAEHPSYKRAPSEALKRQVSPDSGRSPMDSPAGTSRSSMSMAEYQDALNNLTQRKQQNKISMDEYNKEFQQLNSRFRGGTKRAA